MPNQTFILTRTTVPDDVALLAGLRALDATMGIAPPYIGTVIVKKNTAWTSQQITAAKNVLETSPASTPQRVAQNNIDKWPIELRALVLTLVDQINVLRAAANPVLPAITPTQAIAAIRTKAGTL